MHFISISDGYPIFLRPVSLIHIAGNNFRFLVEVLNLGLARNRNVAMRSKSAGQSALQIAVFDERLFGWARSAYIFVFLLPSLSGDNGTAQMESS